MNLDASQSLKGEAKVFEMSLYKVIGNEDEEGRGKAKILGYFMDEVSANRFAKGKGGFGSDAVVQLTPSRLSFVEVTYRTGKVAYYLLGDEVTQARTKEEIKAEALKKLTPEERNVLGL